MAAKEERPPLPDAPWGIISVKGQPWTSSVP